MNWPDVVAFVVQGGDIGSKRKKVIQDKILSLDGRLASKERLPNLIVSEMSKLCTEKIVKTAYDGIRVKDNDVVFAGADLFKGGTGPFVRDRSLEESFGRDLSEKRRKLNDSDDVQTSSSERSIIKEFRKGGTMDKACKRVAKYHSCNKKIISVFSELLKYTQVHINAGSSAAKCIAYERAIAVLKAWPVEITSANVGWLKDAHMFGESSLSKVREILRTGTLEKLEAYKRDHNLVSILDLTEMHGIGVKRAQSLVKAGISSRDCLIERYRSKTLSKKLGPVVEFSLENSTKLETWTMTQAYAFINEIINPAIEKLVEEHPNSLKVDVEIVGGFRRKKPNGHDLDILFCFTELSPERNLEKEIDFQEYDSVASEQITTSKPLLQLLIQKIMNSGMQLKVLSSGSEGRFSDADSALCTYLFFFEFQNKWRRVDFVLVPKIAWAFALLGWSGSKYFEKSIRSYATSFRDESLGEDEEYLLSSFGLFKVDKRTKAKNSAIVCITEEDVFKCLNLNYLKPEERCH